MASFKIKAVFLPVMVFLLTSVTAAFQKEALPNHFQGLFDSEEVLDIRLEGYIESLLKPDKI